MRSQLPNALMCSSLIFAYESVYDIEIVPKINFGLVKWNPLVETIYYLCQSLHFNAFNDEWILRFMNEYLHLKTFFLNEAPLIQLIQYVQLSHFS